MARPEYPAAKGQKEGQEKQKKQKRKERAQEGKGAGSSQGVSQEDWHLEGRQKKQTDKGTGNQNQPKRTKGGHKPHPKPDREQPNKKSKTGSTPDHSKPKKQEEKRPGHLLTKSSPRICLKLFHFRVSLNTRTLSIQ